MKTKKDGIFFYHDADWKTKLFFITYLIVIIFTITGLFLIAIYT